MKVRPSIAIVENNHLLLMQYRYGNTDVYNLPGGNVDKGETLSETVVRELMEELGVEVNLETMIFPEESSLVPAATLSEQTITAIDKFKS